MTNIEKKMETTQIYDLFATTELKIKKEKEEKVKFYGEKFKLASYQEFQKINDDFQAAMRKLDNRLKALQMASKIIYHYSEV